MAMLIAWQALNRLSSSAADGRYSSDILAVAPGLTVKRRLSVLNPVAAENYYKDFDLIPDWGEQMIRRARVRVVNWHALMADKPDPLSVDKRGPKSDRMWAKDVLGEMADAQNFIVINDEAHHAWRAEAEEDGDAQSTVWIQGLDRLDETLGIMRCYDFSATPFASPNGTVDENSVFKWIVSDFGLSDAIEAGLVKTPRLVARDDSLPGRGGVPKLRHIYQHVEKELREGKTERLPALVTQAYALLGSDWIAYRDAFREKNHKTPPVMISVVNSTRAAKRIEDALKNNLLLRGACLPEKTRRIDSSVLEGAENDKQAEALRRIVDTVGQPGQPGADLEHVISVAMLSEGWDAKTVTHIMGLRAFSSQLLCEQVVGRGLRRTTYDLDTDGFLHPEYVNVFGVPFDMMLQGDPDDKSIPMAAAARTLIHPLEEKRKYEMNWPRVARIRTVFSPELKEPDWRKAKSLSISGADIPKRPELAPLLDGRVRMSQAEKTDLRALEELFRAPTLELQAAESVARDWAGKWDGNPDALAGQLISFARNFIARKVKVRPHLPPGAENDIKRRLLIGLSFDRIVAHLADLVDSENTERLEIDLDARPVQSTGDMPSWFTVRLCVEARKSHINLCPCDSGWEHHAAQTLDRMDAVVKWVKNDHHLGFEIFWSDGGMPRKYRPDFLIELSDGRRLILEVKGGGRMLPGMEDEVLAKKRAAERWVEAVNNHGKFGRWLFRQAENANAVEEIIAALCPDSPA